MSEIVICSSRCLGRLYWVLTGPETSSTCLFITSVVRQLLIARGVWLVWAFAGNGETWHSTLHACLANRHVPHIKNDIAMHLWMGFECMNGRKKQNDLALGYYHYFSLSLCCCCCSSFITIKSDIACIYYSARYTETRQPWSLVRVLLCSWLTFKPGCYGFQHRCNMHMLPTWYSTLSQVGNGFVTTSRGWGGGAGGGNRESWM
jgi:hypothetical protein